MKKVYRLGMELMKMAESFTGRLPLLLRSCKLAHSWQIASCLAMTGWFIVFSGATAKGQGIYFSQNNLTPLLYNPAAPALNDEMSLMLNYRDQQSNSQLSLQGISFNGMMPLYNKDKNRRWGGVGIGLLSDKAEDVGALVNQQLMSSFAYNLPFIGKTKLALGVQGAYGQQRFGLENVATGSQWVNNSGYDPSAGTGENFSHERKSYWSVGTGFMWYKENEEGEISYQLGASAYHLNKPQLSFLNENVYQPVNYRAHASLHIPAGRRFILIPELNWQQQNGQHLTGIGSVFRYKFENENPFDPLQTGSIDFLARTILNEAVVTGIQLQQPGYVVGFSYDWGFSTARFNEPGYHASEFAIAIRKPIGRKPKKELISSNSIGELRELFVEEEEKAANAQETATKSRETTTPSDGAQEGGLTQSSPEAGTSSAYKGDGVLFELKKDFKFGFNKAALDEEAKLYLDELFELLQNNAHLKLKVIGHTDDIGTRKANKQVSEKRAQAVADYLLSKGLAPERITTEGKGDTQALKPNDTEENRAANRRVEFILHTR